MNDMTRSPSAPSNELTRLQPREGLADVLDRILEKGVVIAGDIVINLLDIELLTIKIRLLIASVDKARELGIDWWQHDRQLSSGKSGKDGGRRKKLEEENRMLRGRLERLESKLGALAEQLPRQAELQRGRGSGS
jgi:hypothetical protein